MRAGIRSIALAAVLAVTIVPAAALAEDRAADAKAALAEVLGEIFATARDENVSADQKRALITFEKGGEGEALFKEVMAAWEAS